MPRYLEHEPSPGIWSTKRLIIIIALIILLVIFLVYSHFWLSLLVLIILVLAAPKWRWMEDRIGALTFVAVLVAAYTVWSASEDAETQRFNTAWMLVNASNNNSPPSANGGQVDGGGRKTALDYLRKNRQSLQGANLSQAILSYAHLDGMDLNRTNMTYTDLFGSDLRAASLWSAIMTDANLQFAQLKGADLHDADLQCADLRAAHLEQLPRDEYLTPNRPRPSYRNGDQTELTIDAIAEYLGLADRIEGRVRNEYVTRRARRRIPTNLTRADLSFAHLEGADLEGANLAGAILMNAHLEGYNDIFSPTIPCKRAGGGLLGLSWSGSRTEPPATKICDWASTHPDPKHPTILPDSFSCSRLGNGDSGCAKKPATNLKCADLTGTVLTDADLTGTVLTGADLTGADLRGAIGMKKEQIDYAGYLCHTLLPDISDIRHAETMGDRDCLSDARKIEEQDIRATADGDQCTDPASSTSAESSDALVGSHKEICDRAPYDDNCMKYDTFASDYADIKKYCTKKAHRSTPCINGAQDRCRRDEIDEYIACLSTHFQAIEIQKFIKSHDVRKTVTVNTLQHNPYVFKKERIAIGGFYDKVLSKNKAMFVGMKQGSIIITNVSMDKIISGMCVLVVQITDNEVIRDSGGTSGPAIEFVDQLCDK